MELFNLTPYVLGSDSGCASALKEMCYVSLCDGPCCQGENPHICGHHDCQHYVCSQRNHYGPIYL